ncbi:MAG: tolB protein [Polyangiaceae bacterium]
MTTRLPFLAPVLLCLAVALVALAAPRAATADVPPGAPNPPDDSVLGTVEVNGSAGGLPPLPKMAVVPILLTAQADSIVNLVTRHDMVLSGQFDVLDESAAPQGPFTHTSPLDLAGFRQKGAEYVVRVFAQAAPTDSTKTELVGEAYVTPTAAQAAAQKAHAAAGAAADVLVAPPVPVAKPAFRGVVPTATTEVRAASHRLVDLLLGALTGRPGGFASEMTYAQKVGHWHRIFRLDSDGFDLRGVGPSNATAISPAFGPGGNVFYALSTDYSPFRVAYGDKGTPVPMDLPGSVMGLAFSADRTRMAVTTMDGGQSRLWMGDDGRLALTPTAPFANHPVFGPLGKVAYVAGSPVQRVYVDGKPISPPGFMASAPVFCDTPQGLLLVFTVGVGTGADIIETDTSGGGLRRLTQHEGANTYAACSPDGRLISFFSTGKRGQGAGLFVMPIQRPWLAKKISSEVGDALRWEPIVTATAPARAK